MRIKWAALALAGMLALCGIASGESELPETLIHQALLATMPAAYYPDCEYFAEGHTVLGSQEMADGSVEVYLSASVGGYGFMGGGFTLQSGWGGPCTVVLERSESGGWALREVKEIEDYSEIPSIMPSWAEERFFALEGNAAMEQINAQLQAYLDNIGRTEPIRSYAEVSGEPSGMLQTASSLCFSMFYPRYPLNCTTLERLEADGRYVYSRTWSPDPEGVQGYVYRGAQGELHVSGATGTETLTRTRKADGKLMETITIRAELYELTLTLQDGGGSIRYTFPYDEQQWTYCQPTVTREGQCSLDVSCVEQAIVSLPVAPGSQGEAAAPAGEQLLAQQAAGQKQRFTLARRQGHIYLRAESQTGGAWTTLWENATLLPNVDYGWVTLNYIPEVPGEVTQYERFSKHWGNLLTLYAGMEGADHETVCLWLEQDGQGLWNVVRYNDDLHELHAYLLEDRLLFNAGDFSQTQTSWLDFTAFPRQASRFDPAQLQQEQEAFRARTQSQHTIGYFAGAEPLYVAPGWDLRAAVHTAPQASSPQAANGKASVSFRDWVTVLCRQDQWLMVFYETSQGHYRTGWLDATQDERLMRIASAAMAMSEPPLGAASSASTLQLFDDPVHQSGTVCTVPSGTKLTLLCDVPEYGDGGLYYAEVILDGQVMRGFVRCGDVVRD